MLKRFINKLMGQWPQLFQTNLCFFSFFYVFLHFFHNCGFFVLNPMRCTTFSWLTHSSIKILPIDVQKVCSITSSTKHSFRFCIVAPKTASSYNSCLKFSVGVPIWAGQTSRIRWLCLRVILLMFYSYIMLISFSRFIFAIRTEYPAYRSHENFPIHWSFCV